MRIVFAAALVAASLPSPVVIRASARVSRHRLAIILALIPLLVLVALARVAGAQTKSFADPAVPVALAIGPDYSIVYALNQDRSISEFATEPIENGGYSCPAAPGLAAQGTTPHAFAYDGNLYEIGPVTGGTSLAVAAILTPNYYTCQYAPLAPISGNATTVLLATGDPRHHRVFVVAGDSGSNPETIDGFNTSNFTYGNSGALIPLGQATLDQDAQYTAIVTDADAQDGDIAGRNGDTFITSLRSSSSNGNLWLYDANGKSFRILAPDGSRLPAINAFILHNPYDVAGGLLVLVNQDGLTAANIAAPPLDPTPFTIIDIGLLHQLIDASPGATTITLPSMTKIGATIPYYAMLGAAYNPVNHLLYAVVGAADQNGNPVREILSYDPTTPSAPDEQYVADVTSIPIVPPDYPQVALNAASGTMQFLMQNPAAVYTVPLKVGNDIPVLLGATTFSDAGFAPTAMAVNPLAGNTYIASSSGYVDTLTLPSGSTIQDSVDMTSPLLEPYLGQDTSVLILGRFPLIADSALAGISITVTAQKQPSGVPFTFATINATYTRVSGAYVTGSFYAPGIYTLTANFPGDAIYPPVTSPPVEVSVLEQPFVTSISLVPTSTTSTNGTALVTLTGTTFAPTGTITIVDATTGALLGTYTLTGGITAPITVPFTIGTSTSVKASYSGDSLNSSSLSGASVIMLPSATTPTLAITGASSAVKDTSVALHVAFNSTTTTVPTGSISLVANFTGGSFNVNPTSVTAANAFVSGGVLVHFVPPLAANFTISAVYTGDQNYAPASASFNLVATGSTSTLSLTPVLPATTQNPFNVTVAMVSNDTTVPTGNITLTSLSPTGLLVTQDVFPAAQAFSAAGVPQGVGVNLAGLYTLTATYPGDSNFAPETATTTVNVVQYGPQSTLSPATLSFADQTIGTDVVHPPLAMLTNVGGTPLTVTSIVSSNPTEFEVQDVNCLQLSPLPQGTTCSVMIKFHPKGFGAQTASIQFNISDPNGPQVLRASGNGLTSGACLDSDHDGLCDDWETNGVMVVMPNGTEQFIDLPSMGADPRHKDIFIHVDYMETDPGIKGAHSHKLLAVGMNFLESTFNTAPVPNIDGTNGIHLHIDCGSDCIMNPVTGKLWGAASQASPLPEQTPFDPQTYVPNATPNFNWAVYDTLSKTFNLTGRSIAFHHVISGHDQLTGFTSSGISRNDPTSIQTFRTGASEYLVSLGSWPKQTGTVIQQVGTTMHELGHNLSLQHGGRDEFNFKPNDFSVMNYAFQTVGTIINSKSGIIDYSEFALPNMDESNLDEATGISADPKVYLPLAGSTLDKFGTYWYCNGDNRSVTGPQVTTNALKNVNWDCDKKGVISASTSGDVNNDGKPGIYGSVQEWPLLVLTGGSIGSPGAPEAVMQTPAAEFNHEQASAQTSLYGVSVMGMGVVQSAAGSTISPHFVVTNLGLNADTYTLTSTSQLGWSTGAPSATTLTLAPGASSEVTLSYTVPAGAAAGTRDELTLMAVSTASANIFDASEVALYAVATPPPFAISAATLTFGTQATGSTSATIPLVITNTGASALAFGGATASAEFTGTSNCGASLAIGQSCTISVAFSPAAAGSRTGTLTINTGASTTVALQGTGAVVNNNPRPDIALAVSPSSTSTGQPVILTATLTPSAGGAIPTGSVSFLSGGNTLGTASINGTGTATFTTTSLAAGSYLVVAQYAGDAANKQASSSNQPLTIAAALASATALTASSGTTVIGASITFTATVSQSGASAIPTGMVSFLDGTTLLAAVSLNGSGVASLTTSALAVGTHSISATYAGDAIYAASSAAPIQQIVQLNPTATGLAASKSPVIVGAALTLTASVTSSGGAPSGSVNFYDGSTLLGSTALTAGSAVFSTSTLTVGTHALSAAYQGSTTFAQSTSTPVQEPVVLPPDYSVTASPSSITIMHGQTGAATFTVTSINYYVGAISFGCGTVPADVSCTFAPPQATFTAASQSPQTVIFTIDTKQLQSMLQPTGKAHGSGLLAFALCLPGPFLGLLVLRKKPHSALRGFGLVLLLLAACGLFSLTGCNVSSAPTTPAGTYSVPITITDGAISHSLTFTVIVQ